MIWQPRCDGGVFGDYGILDVGERYWCDNNRHGDWRDCSSITGFAAVNGNVQCRTGCQCEVACKTLVEMLPADNVVQR